jgi:hypothetical protein
MTYYVLAAGFLGMAIIVTGENAWYAAWLAVVICFILFMRSNRGQRVSPLDRSDPAG